MICFMGRKNSLLPSRVTKKYVNATSIAKTDKLASVINVQYMYINFFLFLVMTTTDSSFEQELNNESELFQEPPTKKISNLQNISGIQVYY